VRIDDFNALPSEEAAELVRACADAGSWVTAVVEKRPYPDVATLLDVAGALAEEWTADDVAQALSHHPRIGERPSGAGASAAASSREQAGLDPADADLTAALRAGNEAYEARFGRIYLVRAKGRSGPELLALLEQRLHHDPETEYGVMVGQLREIALLRMGDLFA
jgi:2-oxo-4-hydroxy-4-carboxy-5-ureidoimidazoline decarboxylase